MTADPQATLVVEYPCDRFCRIEVDLTGERSQATLQQLRDKADRSHQRVHNPEQSEPEPQAAEQEPTGRPASTVFLSAPGPGRDQRR